MALSRKMRRGKMSRRRHGKKMSRSGRRRQGGGGEYVLKFNGIPAAGSSPPEGLADLGTYSASNQGFSIATNKNIRDVRIFKGDGVTELTARSFGTAVQTKIKIQVGSTMSLVPSTVTVRGATTMNPSATPLTGTILVQNLNASTLQLLAGAAQNFVVKVTTV